MYVRSRTSRAEAAEAEAETPRRCVGPEAEAPRRHRRWRSACARECEGVDAREALRSLGSTRWAMFDTLPLSKAVSRGVALVALRDETDHCADPDSLALGLVSRTGEWCSSIGRMAARWRSSSEESESNRGENGFGLLAGLPRSDGEEGFAARRLISKTRRL